MGSLCFLIAFQNKYDGQSDPIEEAPYKEAPYKEEESGSEGAGTSAEGNNSVRTPSGDVSVLRTPYEYNSPSHGNGDIKGTEVGKLHGKAKPGLLKDWDEGEEDG